MEKISVIVPVYHGKQYIKAMIAQTERASLRLSADYKTELLLVNDAPEEPLGQYASSVIEVVCIETERNRGIHGARVRGLEYCSGDHILFLDQDDRIEADYLKSQLEEIGNADAVVCKLLHEKKQFYDTRMVFEAVINKQYMIGQRNPIISPGQVLIRKDAIPDIWKKTRLKDNGADDWLLWICMMAEGKQFGLNPKILFEHVVEGSNTSLDVGGMIRSEREVFDVLSQSGLLTEEELSTLQRTLQRIEQEHIRMVCKFQKMFFVCHTWMELQNKDISIADHLRSRNIKKVAIYADGYLGKSLYHNLKKDGVCVAYFIDINAEFLEEEIPVYAPGEELPEVDAVIISLVEHIEDVRETLAEKLKVPVWDIGSLLCRMEKDGRPEGDAV